MLLAILLIINNIYIKILLLWKEEVYSLDKSIFILLIFTNF